MLLCEKPRAPQIARESRVITITACEPQLPFAAKQPNGVRRNPATAGRRMQSTLTVYVTGRGVRKMRERCSCLTGHRADGSPAVFHVFTRNNRGLAAGIPLAWFFAVSGPAYRR